MLYTETVSTTCLAVLKRIMEIYELDYFRLVGGTALSLKYGHRVSEDIDLFSSRTFENDELEKVLRFYFIENELADFRQQPFGLFCSIEGIKSDFIFWGDEFIDDFETEDGIRIASDKDIFAMKLNAAMKRGAKKDFIDLALLIQKYSLHQGIDWYKKKFPYNDEIIPIKTLTDFERSEEQTTPILLKSKNWESCKSVIIEAMREYVENEES
jgi:predicted nucleotidyltransferase component of viral defense system